MDKPDTYLHDVRSPSRADVIRLILLVVGAILLIAGWYQWLR